jgi:hypothetical protein
MKFPELMDVTKHNERGGARIYEALGGDNVVIGVGQDCEAVFHENLPHTLLQPTDLPFCERRGSGPAEFSVRAHCLARA